MSRRRVCMLFALAAVCVAAGGKTLMGQIILNGPNLSGTVGVTGETFGSGWLYFSWNGGNVQTQLINGDSDFSVRVEPDRVLSVSVQMNSFQNATNAHLYHSFSNVTGPSATATTPLQLTLARPGGRVLGRVAVTGGAVSRVDISGSKAVSSSEYVSGSASTNSAPYEAVMPFVAAPGVTVKGTAILRAGAGCEVPVTLSPQAIDISAGTSAIANWSFDLTGETCNQGGIQGQLSFTGLTGPNADAIVQQRWVWASGPVSRTLNTDLNGNFIFSSVPPGSYYMSAQTAFAAPYGQFYSPSSQVSVAAGALVTKNFLHDVGTLSAIVQPKGAWTRSSATRIFAYTSVYDTSGQYVGQGSDTVDVASGRLNYVLPAGSARLESLYTYFSKWDGVRSDWQYFYKSFYPGNYPVQATLTAGGRVDSGTYEFDTSESLVVVQPANSAVGLSRLQLSGSSPVQSAAGVWREYRYIDMTSTAIGTPQNSVAVLLRGAPGIYQMNASGQGTDGATYSKQFELVLGAPQNTPTGADVVTPISIVDSSGTGSTTGSITFGNVLSQGETTISASGSGPQAPGNFRVFGAGSRLFYDIQTTATFDASQGATLCLSYNDSGMNLNQERQLTLQHYVCANPQTNTGCNWEEITSAGSPDTTANMICGVTPSFSIFAILQPLDQDVDGVLDANDNCPAVANADQTDSDADGLGDRCDLDQDGDLIDDTADNCPALANADQADLDGDRVGDACDPDTDGDGIANDNDNCRVNANPSQADFDGDSSGDACDLDDDNDGVLDAGDSCAGTATGAGILPNGCSGPQLLELACSKDAVYRNHGQYVQCVAHEAERQVALGLITAQDKDAVVATAATSTTGKK